MAGHIELGVVGRSLRVAHVAAVYPHVGAAVYAVEVEEDTFVAPAFGQGEVAAVGAYGVGQAALHGDVGRIVGKGVVHVDIERNAVAFHLQAGRHADGVPGRNIGSVGPEGLFARPLVGRAYVVEFPQSVESEHFRTFRREPGLVVACVFLHLFRRGVGNVGGVGGFLVLFKELLVFPVVAGQFGRRRHGAQAEACVFARLLHHARGAVVGGRDVVVLAVAGVAYVVHSLFAVYGYEGRFLIVRRSVGRPLQGAEGTLQTGVERLVVGLVEEDERAAGVAALKCPYLPVVGFFRFVCVYETVVGETLAVGEHLAGGRARYHIRKAGAGHGYFLARFLQPEVGCGSAEIGLHLQLSVLQCGQHTRAVGGV